MIFSYGSRRLWTNAFSFCRTAVLANAEISSIDCRLSFGSLVHWRMIFRRASRCFFITSGIGTLLEVDDFRLGCAALPRGGKYVLAKGRLSASNSSASWCVLLLLSRPRLYIPSYRTPQASP